MHYDRRIPDALLRLVLPDGPLRWLVDWIDTPVAQAQRGRLDFRCTTKQPHGELHLYVGRTKPLTVRALASGQVRLAAHDTYGGADGPLFQAPMPPTELLAREAEIRAHVDGVAADASEAFVSGEGPIHSGFMRCYGRYAARDTAVWAFDSEIEIEHASKAARARVRTALRAEAGLPRGQSTPKKLDALAVRRDGTLLLVEVKGEGGDVARAAWQLAFHVAAFERLAHAQPDLPRSLDRMAFQKRQAGLLGGPPLPRIRPPLALAPVLAAPDARPDWADLWRRALAPVVAAAPQLDGLLLWRLDGSGAIVEEAAA